MNVFNLSAKLLLNKKEYSDGLKEAQGESQSFGSKIGSGLASVAKVGAQALAVATTAVAGFGASAIKTGMEFDSSMSQVEATMGDNAKKIITYNGQTMTSIDALREYAQQMGATTAFSASQASEALNYMALAGYDAETSMEVLPSVLNLASAGGIELAQASDMVTDALSALGKDSEYASTMVDQMAVTSQKSNTSVAQLGEAMLAIGATGTMMAGGTTELSTALGILANNGTKGAEGGTRLRNILLSLGSPTDNAQMALDALGVSAYDADGNMRPLQDTLADLNGAMEGMTQGEKTNIISTIFNKTDLGDVNYLLGVSTEEWNTLSEAVDNSAGSAEAMANIQLDNLSGDITLMKSAFEGFQIAVSEGGTGTLRSFVQFAGSSLSTLTEAYKKDGVKGAMEAMSGILSDGLKMLADVLPKVVSAGMDLLSAVVDGLSSNMDLITSSALDIILTLCDGIIDNLPSIIDSAIKLVVSLAEGIASALPELIPTAIDAIITIVDGFIDNIDKIVDAGINILMALIEGIIKALPRLIQKAPEIIVKLVKALIDARTKLFEACISMIETIWTGLKENLPTLISKIPEIITGIVDALKGGTNDILAIGSEWIESLWNGIGNKMEWIKEKISGLVGNVKEWLKKFFGGGGDEESGESDGNDGTAGNYSLRSKSLIEDLTSLEVSQSESNKESSKDIIKAIEEMNSNMYSNMVNAISNGLSWEWDDRQLGRMVRNYA